MSDDGFEEVNAGHLRAFVERIERLNEEKKALCEDIKEVYAEAKSNGFDPKIIRKIVSIRGLDPDKRAEEEALLDVYLKALGMLADTPLGEAATKRAVEEAGKPKGESGKKGAFKRKVKDKVVGAISKLGKPVALNDEEKRQGMSAAFEQQGGTRMSIGFGVPVG